ncbi:MAG TPA: hypothetical protein VGB68_19285 [Pyrinomonadaceae bacterium]|jgi:hypothetical protein
MSKNKDKNKDNNDLEDLESRVKKAELILQLKRFELETLKVQEEIRKVTEELKSTENPELTS